MIRFIAAIDKKYGLADEHGIPWQGRLPSDVKYYHDKIRGTTTLIGYGMYKELRKPLVNKVNYVASSRDATLKAGFILVQDAEAFLKAAENDVWVLGGAALFKSTLHLADELYLTRIDADFSCTKFFPAFESEFIRSEVSASNVENGLTFKFEVWQRSTRDYSVL